MTLDLKSYLDARLRNVPQDWVRSCLVVDAAAKSCVLPLCADWSGYHGIREDASVVFVPYDAPRDVQPETDARIRNMVLFQGALRYPELSVWVPRRGEDDETCPACGGSGVEPSSARLGLQNVICFCGGLGWIPKSASR